MTAREQSGVAGEVRTIYMTVEQYAEHRQVSRTTIFHWMTLGLPSVKQGHTRRIRCAVADEWLDEGNANAPARAASRAQRR